MAQSLLTPGVYIEEKNTFGNSVVPSMTALPVFIGFTEFDFHDGNDLKQQLIKIKDFKSFKSIFGGPHLVKLDVKEWNQKAFDFQLMQKKWQIHFQEAYRFLLYENIEMFFANGGSEAYVISLGSFYTKESKNGEKDNKTQMEQLQYLQKGYLETALKVSKKALDATLILVPDLITLNIKECTVLQQLILKHCGFEMKNRFAILDLPETNTPFKTQEALIEAYRSGIGTENLAFGAAYFPFVHTLIYNEMDFHPGFFNASKTWNTMVENAIKEELFEEGKVLYDEYLKAMNALQYKRAHDILLNNLIWYRKLIQKVKEKYNILNTSGAIAGIYARTDLEKGIWKAPANTSMNMVDQPVQMIDHKEQESLNIHPSGKSINAIRHFRGEGALVWGARTLDGNSRDWRYINVRRTMIYLEESIRKAIKPYVFEANSPNTWVLIKSMISSFLLDFQKQGGLAGASPKEAFEVQLGLGATMTNEDVLDGIMRIEVKVALLRPAEFIVLTFQQQMQES